LPILTFPYNTAPPPSFILLQKSDFHIDQSLDILTTSVYWTTSEAKPSIAVELLSLQRHGCFSDRSQHGQEFKATWMDQNRRSRTESSRSAEDASAENR